MQLAGSGPVSSGGGGHDCIVRAGPVRPGHVYLRGWLGRPLWTILSEDGTINIKKRQARIGALRIGCSCDVNKKRRCCIDEMGVG